MLAPVKIDGFGTRRNASDTEVANLNVRDQYVRMFAGETMTKGDAVALYIKDTEPAEGYGNVIMKADTGQREYKYAIGILAEDSGTVTGTDYPIVKVQVSGICTFAKVGANISDQTKDGFLVCASNEAGELEDLVTDAALGAGGDQIPIGILIEFGTDATADSKVLLRNPFNL